MVVDLVNSGGSSRTFDLTVEPGEIDLDSENARLSKAASAKGEIVRNIAQTDVRGSIEAEMEFDCTRCLNPVTRELKISFDVNFVAGDAVDKEAEAELTKQDLDTSVIEGSEIDLTELVREQILLNLPEQIFCREDCKGLCPKCGADRNLIDCKCEENEIDPRWAALKNLN